MFTAGGQRHNTMFNEGYWHGPRTIIQKDGTRNTAIYHFGKKQDVKEDVLDCIKKEKIEETKPTNT